jgi:hypothetical protein
LGSTAKILDNFLKICASEIPLFGTMAAHMVKFAIPNDIDYCFEIKDYRAAQAKYRFSGAERKDTWGLMDFIGTLSEVKGAVGTMVKIMGIVDKVKYAEKIAVAVKAYNEAAAKFDSLIRKHVGNSRQ